MADTPTSTTAPVAASTHATAVISTTILGILAYALQSPAIAQIIQNNKAAQIAIGSVFAAFNIWNTYKNPVSN